jgi:hypothetical protein
MESTENERERRERAYRAGARISKDRMRVEAPLDAHALEQVEASDIVVVHGIYDHVEQVLDALEMPFTPVEPGQVGGLRLRPEQLLVVNCPGDAIGPEGIRRIRTFVEGGGSLFSTDWALRHVLEPAFPGLVAFNEHPTADDVVRIEVRAHDNPFLRGVIDPGEDPLWWLEGSSYPIRVLDPEHVQVLIASTELQAKYGESAVAVLFHHGEGEVFHMVSHYYLQRTELREARQRVGATAYASSKGVALDAEMAAQMADLSAGEVESAGSSSRLFANMIADKKRRAMAERRQQQERK